MRSQESHMTVATNNFIFFLSREGDAFVNGGPTIVGVFLAKSNSHRLFRASTTSAVPQNNQFKIILIPKIHNWGWYILLCFLGIFPVLPTTLSADSLLPSMN